VAVWAHPDDESYLGAGLMAAITAAGGRVVNVTATLGEHGTPDPGSMPARRLAAIRRGELEGALRELGVGESIVLGYGDGALASADPDIGARRLAAIFDEIDPELVISFGPDGFTGHPDHIAIGAWTQHAVASRPTQPALLQTASARWLPRDLIDAMDELDAFFPGFDPGVAGPLEFRLAIDGDALDTKLSALAAHRSQTTALREHLGVVGYRRLAAIEAYQPVNTPATDLVSTARARMIVRDAA
jgi:LmbE family N-acetylglucosaminyl deacetylase